MSVHAHSPSFLRMFLSLAVHIVKSALSSLAALLHESKITSSFIFVSFHELATFILAKKALFFNFVLLLWRLLHKTFLFFDHFCSTDICSDALIFLFICSLTGLYLNIFCVHKALIIKLGSQACRMRREADMSVSGIF